MKRLNDAEREAWAAFGVKIGETLAAFEAAFSAWEERLNDHPYAARPLQPPAAESQQGNAAEDTSAAVAAAVPSKRAVERPPSQSMDSGVLDRLAHDRGATADPVSAARPVSPAASRRSGNAVAIPVSDQDGGPKADSFAPERVSSDERGGGLARRASPGGAPPLSRQAAAERIDSLGAVSRIDPRAARTESVLIDFLKGEIAVNRRPGVKQIAKATGLTRQSVRNAIDRLTGRGVLRVIETATRREGAIYDFGPGYWASVKQAVAAAKSEEAAPVDKVTQPTGSPARTVASAPIVQPASAPSPKPSSIMDVKPRPAVRTAAPAAIVPRIADGPPGSLPQFNCIECGKVSSSLDPKATRCEKCRAKARAAAVGQFR
jgi:hypothetical protein